MTLAEFLLARIAEDESRARELAERRRNIWSEELWDGVAVPYSESPARVLAECEAKRRIVESCNDSSRPHRVPMPWPDGEVIAWKCRACDQWCNDGASDGDCPVDWREPPSVLRMLALPYADHEDYQPEWAL